MDINLLLICIASLMLSTINPPTCISAEKVNKTVLYSAVATGAVCLDGTPPAYYFAQGCDEGVNNWLILLQGGGWCGTNYGCSYRAYKDNTGLGSSTKMNNTIDFQVILSEMPTINPDFYNWNRVYVGYCDGSSFLGDVEEIVPVINITRRGARIFDAVMQDLLAKGMANASMAIFSGESAGALGAILHCDGFRALLPATARVKCISDGGFFFLAKNLTWADFRAANFASYIAYHRVDKFLAKAFPNCASMMNASLCFFPENIVTDISTPLLLVQATFDQYQLSKSKPLTNDTTWKTCTNNLTSCTCSQLRFMQDFQTAFIEELMKVVHSSSSIGIFAHSCYYHIHVRDNQEWGKSIILENKTIAAAIGDWFFERSPVRLIDTQNKCPHYCPLAGSTDILCQQCRP